jgi:hypothetical protein
MSRRLRSVTTTNEASLHPFFRILIGEISAKTPRVSTVQEISEAIELLDVRDQMRLLHDLPAHLKIQPDDVAWLKVAEPAFEFWNNPEDAYGFSAREMRKIAQNLHAKAKEEIRSGRGSEFRGSIEEAL